MKKLNFLGISMSLLCFLCIGLIVSTTTACGKVEGCTDSSAKNYDAVAEEDDGSCTYDARVIFWFGPEVTEELEELSVEYGINVTFIQVRVEDEVKGTLYYDQYHNTKPLCNETNDIVRADKDLGSSKTKSVKIGTYIDVDDDWVLVEEEYITFDGTKDCTTFEIY